MSDLGPLYGKWVFLSASLPDPKDQAAAEKLEGFLYALARGILTSGGGVVFGGHPSVTPLLARFAKEARLPPGRIHLFQLERFRGGEPPEVQLLVDLGQRVDWVPPRFGLDNTSEASFQADLEEMRRLMVNAAADAAVFVGGKTADNVGGYPGIRMEHELFTRANPAAPTYVGGGLLGGGRPGLASGGGRARSGAN